MKKLLVLAFVAVAAGCGSSPDAAPAEPAPAAPNEGLRSQLDAKRAELAKADSDLQKIDAERKELSGQPASETKTNRLVELARLEKDTKMAKASLQGDVADLQRQLGDAPAPAPVPVTKKTDDPLDSLLADAAGKDKEEQDRLKRKQDSELSAERARVAEAEVARKAEEDARAKEKVNSVGVAPAGPDGPIYEERFAQIILKLREDLQRFKRW